jgi:hypothetical protein
VWGRCTSHDNTTVTVRGFCPHCGEVVGERSMAIQEFSVLYPLDHELRDPDRVATTVLVTVPEVRDPDLASPTQLMGTAASRLIRELRETGRGASDPPDSLDRWPETSDIGEVLVGAVT